MLSGLSLILSFIPVAMAIKTWNLAIDMDATGIDGEAFCGFGYTISHNCANELAAMPYACGALASMCCMNSVVRVSASKRLGRGVVETARLRSV